VTNTSYRRLTRRLTTVAALAAVLLSLAPVAGGAELAFKNRVFDFDLPSGEARRTLNLFADQADIQMMVDDVEIGSYITPPLKGRFHPLEALELMIKDAPCKCYIELHNADTVVVSGQDKKRRPKPLRPKRKKRLILPDGSDAQTVLITAPRDTRPLLVEAQQRIQFDRKAIDESPYTNIPNFLKTLPQVFGGGPTEDTAEIGREAQTNSTRGSGINLRGLDAGSTLVLLNGRRLPVTGSEGLFVDVSGIPLTAVEKIDIYPDGASTAYGSDAVGGVVDIQLRRNFNGRETQLKSGIATGGALGETQLSQLWGTSNEDYSVLIITDFNKRDALPASARRYARSDLTPFGGSNFDTTNGSPGTLIAGGQTYAIPHDQDGTSLSASQLVPGTRNLHNTREETELMPANRRWTLLGSSEWQLTEGLRFFADSVVGQRDVSQAFQARSLPLSVPSSNPFYVNPTGGDEPVIVDYNFLHELGPSRGESTIRSTNVGAGFTATLSNTWSLTVSLGHARERTKTANNNQVDLLALNAALEDSNPLTALNPFGDGANTNADILNRIRARYYFESDSELNARRITSRSTLFSPVSGDVQLSMGAEWQDESFNTVTDDPSGGGDIVMRLKRQSFSAFSELTIPLVGHDNSQPYLQALDVLIAARLEDSESLSKDISPRFGLRYSPTANFTLRGTYGLARRLPAMIDFEDQQINAAIATLNDPVNGNMPVLVRFGRNRNLSPEKATTWTVGVEFAPTQAPDFSFSASYFNTHYRDRIDRFLLRANLLSDERIADFITRSPTQQQIADVCSQTIFYAGDAGLPCASSAVGAIADLRLHNMSSLRTSGLDVIGSYTRSTTFGVLALNWNSSYLFDYEVKETARAPTIKLLATENQPLRLRAKTSLSWSQGGQRLELSQQYSSRYRDTASHPNRRVEDWSTYDLQWSYGWETHSAWSGTRLGLSVHNVLNENPPFLNNSVGLGYDAENADLLGRVATISLKRSW